MNSKQTHYCSIYPDILYNIRPFWFKPTPVPTYWGQTLSICEDSTQGFDFVEPKTWYNKKTWTEKNGVGGLDFVENAGSDLTLVCDFVEAPPHFLTLYLQNANFSFYPPNALDRTGPGPDFAHSKPMLRVCWGQSWPMSGQFGWFVGPIEPKTALRASYLPTTTTLQGPEHVQHEP